MEKAKKIITEDLIVSKLEERGVLNCFDSDREITMKQLEDHFDFKLIMDWSSNADYYICEDTTVDGYTVWIATADINNIYVSEDVYYYDHDLAGALCEAITDQRRVIYVDDIYQDFVETAMESCYEEFINDMREEIENELIDEGYELE